MSLPQRSSCLWLYVCVWLLCCWPVSCCSCTNETKTSVHRSPDVQFTYHRITLSQHRVHLEPLLHVTPHVSCLPLYSWTFKLKLNMPKNPWSVNSLEPLFLVFLCFHWTTKVHFVNLSKFRVWCCNRLQQSWDLSELFFSSIQAPCFYILAWIQRQDISGPVTVQYRIECILLLLQMLTRTQEGLTV